MKPWHIIAAIILAPTLVVGVGLLNKPVALVSKATDTTKMLQNYEWFYEASNNFNTRKAQVASLKTVLLEEEDKAEKSRLRIDLQGVQQSCRELAAKYEAQSGKLHVGYLKSNSLPESLNAKECE
ncbi:MAG: hypothetical protein ACXW1D_00120 [Halobacteriota archaeon]